MMTARPLFSRLSRIAFLAVAASSLGACVAYEPTPTAYYPQSGGYYQQQPRPVYRGYGGYGSNAAPYQGQYSSYDAYGQPQQRPCTPNVGGVNAGGAIGAVAGGLLGSTIGRGSGQLAGVGVGAVAGGLIGNSVGNSQYAPCR